MRVVLVDQSRTVQKFVMRLLEERGHDVLPFADGEEALACLRGDETITALITSAEPNSMSGVELCWEARLAASSRRPIYVLMMSSNQDWRNVTEALDSGADDFIGKPPVPEELYARLRVAERLAAMQGELIALATTDPLTGLLNRRAFLDRANAACAQAKTAGAALTLVMLDIDHFKRINDRFGHATGDEVLRAVAHTAAERFDTFGRLGGEEFAALIPRDSMRAVMRRVNALRAQLAALDLGAARSAAPVTCSMGVSTWQPGDTLDRLLRRADVALYQAKAAGRDCVIEAGRDARHDTRREDAA